MCVLFFVSPLLQLSNLLCAHRDQPLKTAAPGSFDSSFLWPTRIPAGAQRARGEGDWRAYFPVAPPALTWPWAKAASIYPGSQLLSGGLFPTAPDHLAHSSCQLGLNIAMLAHSWNHHSHLSKNISLLGSLLIPFEVPSASCWNPSNVAEDAVVRMKKINSCSSWNLLPESNEGVGMRQLANKKLNKHGQC